MAVVAQGLTPKGLLHRGPNARPLGRSSFAAQNPHGRRQPIYQIATAAVAGEPGSDSDEPQQDLTASFAQELQRRESSQAAATEAESANRFDGAALLDTILDKYDRSYDVTLVRREYLGRTFVAMNIMWAYAEQKSFGLSEEEHMNRLDYVAAALRQWGVVSKVKESINGQRNRPRVGKAISIMLDLDEAVAKDWFGS